MCILFASFCYQPTPAFGAVPGQGGAAFGISSALCVWNLRILAAFKCFQHVSTLWFWFLSQNHVKIQDRATCPKKDRKHSSVPPLVTILFCWKVPDMVVYMMLYVSDNCTEKQPTRCNDVLFAFCSLSKAKQTWKRVCLCSHTATCYQDQSIHLHNMLHTQASKGSWSMSPLTSGTRLQFSNDKLARKRKESNLNSMSKCRVSYCCTNIP